MVAAASGRAWPMFALNLLCGQDTYDIDFSPDCTTVEFHDWQAPLGCVRSALRRLFVAHSEDYAQVFYDFSSVARSLIEAHHGPANSQRFPERPLPVDVASAACHERLSAWLRHGGCKTSGAEWKPFANHPPFVEKQTHRLRALHRQSVLVPCVVAKPLAPRLLATLLEKRVHRHLPKATIGKAGWPGSGAGGPDLQLPAHQEGLLCSQVNSLPAWGQRLAVPLLFRARSRSRQHRHPTSFRMREAIRGSNALAS